MSQDTASNKILLDHPDALAVTALRTRSVHAREVLVEAAWPGRSAEEIDAWVADRLAGAEGRHLPPGMDAFHLGQYARVLVLQTGDPDDRRRGRTLLEALATGDGATLTQLHPQAVQLLLHLRCQDRDHAGCAALLDHPQVPGDVAEAVRADLANPFLAARAGAGQGPAPGEVEDWLALLGTALRGPGLAPLRLDPAGVGRPFDRLTTDSPPRADRHGDPLVTVAISTYHPGPPLLTAVRSLLAQSWEHLEVIVVDDASGPAAEPWLQRAESLDPRIRVVRKAVNGGTYRARNTALRQARGQLFTTLDSDDWLHPRAIETLVRALEEDPRRIATRAMGARVDEDLSLVRPGYRHRVLAAPTLLFRVDLVLPRVGFFDPARKAADTEFARRLEAAFGPAAVHTVDTCLLLLRSGETLSSSEFGRGWRHGARHAYKTLYAPWHEEIVAGATAYLDPWTDRPVPEPRRWSRPRDAGLAPRRDLDLVLAGDWRRYGGPQRSMLEELRAAREAGLRVGVLHLEALRFATTRDLPLCAPVVELLRRREVEWVQLDDAVDVEVLLVRYPPVLQHPPHVTSGQALRPRHLLIVANQTPLEPDGTDQRYVVADVTARARKLFGADPMWVPQGPVVREVLREQDPDVALTDWDNPGLIDVEEWSRPPGARAARGPGERPVVGRWSRDHPLKFPRTHAELLQAYDLGPDVHVRMLGGRATWKRLAVEAGLPEDTPLPATWDLLRAGSVDPREFVRGLDLVVYHDNPDRHEAFGRVLLEAAASGVVTIADPKHRPVFGDVLDYAEPGPATRELVQAYLSSPDRYRERSREQQRLVRERYSHTSFLDRLASVPGVRAGWAAGQVDDAAGTAPWRGEARLQVHATGERTLPLAVTVETLDGDPLGAHTTPLRTAADGTRADQLVVLHRPPWSTTTREGLGAALDVPAEGDVDEAVIAAVDGRPDVAAVVLSRDGEVRVVATGGAVVDDGGPFRLAGGSRTVRLRRG
ncbi:glycosyltransferase [Ornithinimicrobium kibberense]|uniref:Glycosyltransferase n=1 Tax=Ornithinimicrobium kibberense TaxID=282060 RepID=A0ABV5V1C6_9MICO|nr:glycosyltransferase [Ornithinimicrobium kibberense]